ncbi:MAG: hypothetical protein HQL87_11695 [Magnetococcales bacterium]|nr:hypothetical protein [Magnetococcales bacterium]
MPDSVIPAKAGIQPTIGNSWIPACAGMTFFHILVHFAISSSLNHLQKMRVQGDHPPGGVQGQSPWWGSGAKPLVTAWAQRFFFFFRAFCPHFILCLAQKLLEIYLPRTKTDPGAGKVKIQSKTSVPVHSPH